MNIPQQVIDKLERELKEELSILMNKETDIAELQSGRRQERLRENYHRLAKIEPLFMDMVNQSMNWAEIKPELKVVKTDYEIDLWFYTRNVVCSMPDNKYVGRKIAFYLADRVSERWLGILFLGSSLGTIRNREQYLKWNTDVRFRNLAHIMNIAVCVPVQPFGTLCGGKLMCLAMLSNEVVGLHKDMFGDDMLAVETTSLYGKSSQYNRLPEYKFLGTTDGFGNTHIPEQTYARMQQYYEIKGMNCTGNHSQKTRLIIHVMRRLFPGLKDSDRQHGYGRGYYWGITASNSETLLKEESTELPDYYDRPFERIVANWRDRWYLMRLDKKAEDISSFDTETYRLDRNVVSEIPMVRQLHLM